LAAFDGQFPKKFMNEKISQRFLTQAALLLILSQTSLPWQQVSMGVKCDWQHSMAHPRKPFYGRKNFAKISYASGFIAHFVSKFRCHVNKSRSEKNAIGSIRWPIFENPL